MKKILALAAFVAFSTAVLGAADPRLFFSKKFPGSAPEYYEITVEKDGSSVYKEAPDDDFPLKFQLQPAEVEAMFSLAEKLGHFSRPLESPLKVARMGLKTLRFEDGGGKPNEVQFNFSEDLDARALTDWFEKISESAQVYGILERSVKYDKLGVNKAILRFEAAKEKGRIVSLPTFLPLLDRVAKNESYLNMARARAGALAEAIRAAQ